MQDHLNNLLVAIFLMLHQNILEYAFDLQVLTHPVPTHPGLLLMVASSPAGMTSARSLAWMEPASILPATEKLPP